MPLPRELTVEQCKLLQNDALVERYQRFRKVLDTIEKSKSLEIFATRPAFAGACEELDKLAVRMSRERFRIGFLGVSRAGKSTTAGCVVDAVNDEDNPAPPGDDGKAATAIATRILPVPKRHPKCLEGEKHFVELVYVTERQFLQRIQDIFRVLDLEFDAQSGPDKWLTTLQQPVDSTKTEDRDTAIRLINALKIHGNELVSADAPVIQQGSFNFKKRQSYVVHPEPDQHASSELSKYALLREMRVWYSTEDTECVPETLELIDLPGLGVERMSDEALTTAFLPELDGAFIFSTDELLAGGPAAILIRGMRAVFGDRRAAERMWIVTTKVDRFKAPDFANATRGKIKTLDEVVERHKFVKNNIVFVSNTVFKTWRNQSSECRNSGQAWAECDPKPGFQPEYDGNSELIIPEAIQSFSDFTDAYRGLAANGGIHRIRNLMTTKVEAAVRKQTQDLAVQVMNDAVQSLSKDLAASREMGGMRHEQRADAAIAARLIEEIAEDLERPNDRVDGMAANIIDTLGVLLEQFFGDRTSSPARPECTSFANALKAQGALKAMDIIPEAVDGVSDDIDAIAKECSAMSVEAVIHAMEKWRDACVKLKDGLSPDGEKFLEHCLQEFQMPSHLADEMWSHGRGPSVSDYRELMRKKIVLVAHDFVSRLAKELAAAVKMFSGRMRSVGDESAVANPVQIESIKAIERELQQLQAI